MRSLETNVMIIETRLNAGNIMTGRRLVMVQQFDVKLFLDPCVTI